MFKYVKLLILLIFPLIFIFGTNIFAEGNGYRAYISSSETDSLGIEDQEGVYKQFIKPKVEDETEQVAYADDYPGHAYILANRHLDGHWNNEYFISGTASRDRDHHYDYTESEPPVQDITYTVTVSADSYGLGEFSGWTKVPNSNIGGKSGKATGYFNDIGEGFAGDSSSPWSYYDYVNLNINGENKYWLYRWDFWNGGSWNPTGTVDVEISADKKTATITRTAFIGPTGYVNAPLLDNSPGHEEWQARFGLNPDSTFESSNVLNSFVETRVYGLGERIYFFGKQVAVVQPPILDGDVNLVISLEEVKNIDGNTWVSEPIHDLRIKSGYGIPLSVEVQGFDYKPKPTGCAFETRIDDDVRIVYDDQTWVKVDSDNFNRYIFENAVPGIQNLDLVKDSGTGAASKLRARFLLKEQTGVYPLGKRKLYSKDNQADGTYNLTVTAQFKIMYTEHYVYESYCCEEYCACACCPRWTTREVTEIVNEQFTVHPIIDGSMHEDDTIVYE